MKEAWDKQRDALVKSGAFAIEQLSEALSAGADSNKLADGVSESALRLCSEQVRICSSIFICNILCQLNSFLHNKKWLSILSSLLFMRIVRPGRCYYNKEIVF